MFDSLFELPLPARFFIAFLAVLALIALTAWLVRRFGANRLGGASRGRMPRLAVIDAASVDGRRRLVLVRRDNVEHLLMIGGPTDVVIEPNIVRAGRDLNRETPRASMAGDTLPRAVPLGDAGSWPLQPANEPAPSRPSRPAVVDEPWVPASDPGLRARPPEPDRSHDRAQERLQERNHERIPERESAPKLSADFAPPPPPRPTPPPAPAAREGAPEPAAPPQTDHNLAEMAQRLEAALRRPGAADVQPPVTDPLAVPPVKPPEAPQRPAREPSFGEARVFGRESAVPEPPRVATRDSLLPDMPRTPAREPRTLQPEAKPAPAADKNPFDSLEQEMASLLGRPSGKT